MNNTDVAMKLIGKVRPVDDVIENAKREINVKHLCELADDLISIIFSISVHHKSSNDPSVIKIRKIADNFLNTYNLK